MTCMPASRRARATTLTPRSCPSRPTLASTTRSGGDDMRWRPPYRHTRNDRATAASLALPYHSIPSRRSVRRSVDPLPVGGRNKGACTMGLARPPMARPDNSTTHAGTSLSAFLGGVGFVLTTPSVWFYACVPLAMALLLWCGLAALGLNYIGRITDWVLGEHASTASTWAVRIVGGLVFLFLSAVVALVLAQPLSGWALEAISRKQELRLTGRCA